MQENPLNWTSKYGSFVASAWGVCTTDGMHEAGLSVNMLYLAESVYAARDPSIRGLSMSVYLQYYLNNFATVADAVAASKSFQVQPLTIMHLSLADPSGDSAVIEILNGEVIIHHGKDVTVITNSPPYDEQLEHLKQIEGLALGATSRCPDRSRRTTVSYVVPITSRSFPTNRSPISRRSPASCP